MTLISVMLCSYRWGGLDVSFAGLSKQKFPDKDWELILVDVHYKERKDAVADYIKKKKFKFNIFHTAPSRTLYPVDSGSMHRNSAIMLSEGELCVFLCDYAYVGPLWLMSMWGDYQQNKPNTPMAPHRYWWHPNLTKYHHTDNWWENFPISIFEKDFKPNDLHQVWQGGQDPKLELHSGQITANYFHMKNEAVKLSTLLAINGCEEGFDGGHNNSDIELAERCERAGNGFVLNHDNIAEIVQIREFYPFCERTKTLDDDYKYYMSIRGHSVSDNPYKLAEARYVELDRKHAELNKK